MKWNKNHGIILFSTLCDHACQSLLLYFHSICSPPHKIGDIIIFLKSRKTIFLICNPICYTQKKTSLIKRRKIYIETNINFYIFKTLVTQVLKWKMIYLPNNLLTNPSRRFKSIWLALITAIFPPCFPGNTRLWLVDEKSWSIRNKMCRYI